jgi:hypothetical protein
MLLPHILDSLDSDVVKLRTKLLGYEDEGARAPLVDLATATSDLHKLARDMHVCSEYYSDVEAKLEFLKQSYNSYRSSSWAQTPEATTRQDLSHLEAMKWTTIVSKRWILGYRDRVNIMINHVSCSTHSPPPCAVFQLTLLKGVSQVQSGASHVYGSHRPGCSPGEFLNGDGCSCHAFLLASNLCLRKYPQ